MTGIKQEKEIKYIHAGKEEIQLSLHRWHDGLQRKSQGIYISYYKEYINLTIKWV